MVFKISVLLIVRNLEIISWKSLPSVQKIVAVDL